MRNLKRVLSLGVTAAMISGLMIMGSSAASYADVSSEDNVEAIDVLQAVGVMVGDEDGNFNPDEYVTRNEMAVVMSNLLALNVSNFTSSSIPFTDVPDWAAPYVAACYADGITSGTSDTTYGGDDTVTAAQAGLMMLKALGHFQYSSDFGSDWQLSAVRQASSIDLYDGVDAGASSAMTRNEVAQLALNALEATMVEPSSDGSTIVVGDITVSSNVSYDERTSSNNQYASISNDHADDSDSQYTIELGEELYDGDLEKSSADANEDVFGRPAVTWEYNNDEIGTYADDPEETYTAAVDKDALYDLIGSSVYNDLEDEDTTLDVYLNGDLLDVDDVNTAQDTNYDTMLEAFFDRYNDDDAEYTGRG
ncbi:MAG: S-layer homology domain-containing protein, partial [Oscillospiraceae bacterium]|nr:S-layer homology domain-containing protein [Oscillospiraceae bacterium]